MNISIKNYLAKMKSRRLVQQMRVNTTMMFALVLAGCSTYYYYPTYQSISTNTKSNELKADYFVGGYNEGFSLSYSLSNHLGTYFSVCTFDQYEFKEGAQIADIGFYYFGAKNIYELPNINLTYSLSAAYGLGEYNRHREDYDLDINRFMLQPSFAVTSTLVDFGFSSRFSCVNYKVHRYTEHLSDYQISDLGDAGKSLFYFFEPNIFIGIGYKGVKLNYHYVTLTKMNDSEISYYDGNTAYLSLSVKYEIGKLWQ